MKNRQPMIFGSAPYVLTRSQQRAAQSLAEVLMMERGDRRDYHIMLGRTLLKGFPVSFKKDIEEAE